MPLIIIFAESGIELIPKNIRDHSAIKRNVSPRIYSSQLLDNALHHSAMKKLKNVNKRGRPDITHICLLNALGSTLNKSKNLQLYLHTVHNKIFKFNPEIRIARNFNRFKGLMAKLLIDGHITVNGNRLISSIDYDLKKFISTIQNPEIFIYSKQGELIKDYRKIFPKDISKNIIAIIGSFQKSTFSKSIFELSKNVVSISKYSLDAWVVTNKIINYYELVHEIF